jgi:hypothetical protein
MEVEISVVKKRSRKNKTLIGCIIEDARPFDDFRRHGMKKFLSNYLPPNQNTIQRYLRKIIAKSSKTSLKLSLTVDMWKNKSLTYFMGITADFFNKKIEFVSLLIGFKKFNGRHLGNKLKSLIVEQINQLQISENPEHNIRQRTEFKKNHGNGFGNRISCFCHNLNCAVKVLVNSRSKYGHSNVLQNALLFYLYKYK